MPVRRMILAEMGADVLRVDRPVRGVMDVLDPAADLLGRGKRSIVLDLKRPEAVAAPLDLCDTADVLLEGFRPGVAERLGLGPEPVQARKPRLVYGRMTGWGQHGPDAATAGHDICCIAPTGALHAIGAVSSAPAIPLNLVGDLGGGAAYRTLDKGFTLWPVARSEPFDYLPLNGALLPIDVGTAVMGIADVNDIDPEDGRL